MRRLILGLVLIAMACSQPQARPAASPLGGANSPGPTTTSATTSTAKATPLPKPTNSPTLLFAVLEAKGTMSWNTVAVAGLDGYARAKTTFTPMRVPNVGCKGGAVLPASAHVAAGKVYYADGTGLVRSLAVDGKVANVATFPLTSSQQMLSFAVSPDGTRLLGAVFTLPAQPGLSCDSGVTTHGFTIAVYSAQAGNASKLLYEDEVSVPIQPARIDWGIDVMALVGWDLLGPIALYPSEWISEGGPRLKYRGTPFRVDSSSGRTIQRVSDPGSCYVQDLAQSGNFACSVGVNGDLSVRRPDGTEIWRAVSEPKNDFFSGLLSPDEHRLAVVRASAFAGEVTGQDGSRVPLAPDLALGGWLDSATVIGTNSVGNLSYVTVTSPGTIVNMGFKGQFLGTVRA